MGKPILQRLRDAVRYRIARPVLERTVRLRGRWKHRSALRSNRSGPDGPRRLHVGSGREALPGWLNTDIQAYPEVDVVLDIRDGIPYRDLEYVYSEHFLEHLDLLAALDFLSEANQALAPGGWLRLSTPNLDWVWAYVYPPPPGGDRLQAGLHANRSFYGWRHRFLWNRELLTEALEATGFVDLTWCRWGESPRPELTGIERHERYPDDEERPHVLIVEARKGRPDPERMAEFRSTLDREFLGHLSD